MLLAQSNFPDVFQEIDLRFYESLFLSSLTLSIYTGIFSGKFSKLKALYKIGKKTDPSNHRPISIIPIVFKVIERVIQNQICTFLLENKALHNYQPGYIPNHAIYQCLTYLIDQIAKGFDEGLQHITKFCYKNLKQSSSQKSVQ